MTKRLLIIVPEKISEWINKGEVLENYYNPGKIFDEVHLMILNDDQPDLNELRKLVGGVKFYLHNYPEPQHFFTKTLGWQTWLLRSWVNTALNLIKKIDPNIIRCHGPHLNTYIAAKAKNVLGIPYVVSLHINPDENGRRNVQSFKTKIVLSMLKKIEKVGLRNANLVLPVYEPIVPYLKSIGVSNYKVCYNMSNGEHIRIKNDYSLSSIVRIICIGRVFFEKNPENLIKAIKRFPNIELTIIGTGEYLPRIKQLSVEQNLKNQINFIDSIPNAELCESLPSYDFVALHTEHFEFSKVIIESFLSGMPVMLNYRRNGLQVPELNEKNCLRVHDTVEGYTNGLEKMLGSLEFREKIGKEALRQAKIRCAPEKTIQSYIDVYEEHMLI